MQNPAFIIRYPLADVAKQIMAVQQLFTSDSDVVTTELHSPANAALRLYCSDKGREAGPEYREAEGVDGLPLSAIPAALLPPPPPPSHSPVLLSCQLVCLGSH